MNKKILFCDTETTGLVLHKLSYTEEAQPHMLQLGALLCDKERVYTGINTLVRPLGGYDIHPKAEETHGLSKELIETMGIASRRVCATLAEAIYHADLIVCHNVAFDMKVLMASYHRLEATDVLDMLIKKPKFCTMEAATDLLKLRGKIPGKYKWPKLQELYEYCFGEMFNEAHDAMADIQATRRCYYHLKEKGLF